MFNFLAKLLLGLFSLTIALVIGEAFVSVFAPQPTFTLEKNLDPPVFSASAEYPWELGPGKTGTQYSPHDEFITDVSINSVGMRGPEVLPEGAARRILVFGDSFIFGYGVSEGSSFSRVLERNLNLNVDSGKPFEVLNAGYVSGFGPDAYYAYLKKNIQKLKPEHVVLAIYLGNDVEDMARTKWLEKDESGLPLKLTSPSFYILDDGRRGSPRVSLLGNKLFYRLHIWASQFHLYSIVKQVARRASSRYLPGYLCSDWSEKISGNFNKLTKVLKGIDQLTKANKVGFSIFLISDRTQLLADRWQLYQEQNDCKYDKSKPNKMLLSFCENQGIACYDLLPDFLNGINPEELYFPYDGHWNEAGHAFAVARLLPFIETNLKG